MEKHEEKYCPECNTRFTCKSGDITNCQCNTVTLSQAAQDFLLHTSFDCLCKSCLEKITAAKAGAGIVCMDIKKISNQVSGVSDG